MTAPLQPSNVTELVEAVRSAPRVLPVGARTKPNLSRTDAVAISLRGLTGMVDYAPAEFTFTARAGMPLQELIATLAAQRQYLPFDPPLAGAGATLGGTVAAGLNGPGRLRYGGIRDFILGVQFVDGEGRLLRMGGRVVKNAAGFDLPKFFVGSLGRFGVLVEMTFKVFPRPLATLTLKIRLGDDAAMARLLGDAARSRWDLDALDVSLPGGEIYARLAGPPEALTAIAADIGRRWPIQSLGADEARSCWREANEFAWSHPHGPLCKLPLTLGGVPRFAALTRAIPGARGWIGGAGSVGFISLPEGADIDDLEERLRLLGLAGLVLRGSGRLWLGPRVEAHIHGAVKKALNAADRFPPLF